MSDSFSDQVVVVTGASAGIGAALAAELGGRGASVVLVARRVERLREVARHVGPRTEVVQADVTRKNEVTGILDTAIRRFGHVDIWVNNAGRGISRPLAEVSDEDVDAMIRDNLKSALYGMQVVIPHFKARRKGTLVNVSSMLSRVPFAPQRSVYSAAKAALNSITETQRAELAEFPDIRVALVLPGIVATEFGTNALGGGVDSRRLPGAQSAEEVAKAIAVGLLERQPDIYTRPGAHEQVVKYLADLQHPK